MTCPSCLTALQRADHRDYREGCIGCEVRSIAQMQPDTRRKTLDAIRRQAGEAACERVRVDALREVARMERLRRLARKERTNGV